MKDFKIRSSAIGKIMSLPKTKKAKDAGELSETSKTYVKDWMKEQRFNRRKEFSNKYTVKGIGVEDTSIEMYNRVNDTSYKKNEESFENEFCTGTPDILNDDIVLEIVIDAKSSWNLWTFPLFEDKFSRKTKNSLYWWQLQGYMWLADKPKAQLAYCLVDTPEMLIQKEFNNKKWDVDESLHEALLEEVVKDMTFGDIPEKLRVKTFDIMRDNEAVEEIKERVGQCREYQKELLLFLK